MYILLGGFKSFQRYLIILHMTWFCFSEKMACGNLFNYLLIKMFCFLRRNRSDLPKKQFDLIFNVTFYVALCSSLCISHDPAVFFIKRVITNFAKISKKHLSTTLSFWLSYRDSALNFNKKETQTQMFSCESDRVFNNIYFSTEHLRATASVFCIFFWNFG